MLTKQRLFLCVLALSIVPAFVNTSSFNLNILSVLVDAYPQASFSDGINIHIGTLLGFGVLAALPYLFFLRVFTPRLVMPDLCVILLILFMTMSVFAGLATDAQSVNVAFYFQTLAPIAMYFVGAHLVKDIRLLENIPINIVILNTMTISFMLFFLATQGMLFNSVLIGAYNLAIVFHQAKDFYPLVYFTSVFFIIYIFSRGQKSHLRILIYVVMAIVHASFLYYMWSRAVLFGATVGMMLVIFFELREVVNIRNRTAALGRVMLIFVIVVGIVLSTLVIMTEGIMAVRFGLGSELEESDSIRLDMVLGALERVGESPILGHMFIPEMDTLAGGIKVDVERLFAAHNQYLDYALRGGVQSAILLIVLVMWGICEGLRAYPVGSLPRNIDIFRKYLGAFMVMAAITSLFGVYFVQTLSASITWLFLGILARLHIERKKSTVFHGYRAARPGAYGR